MYTRLCGLLFVTAITTARAESELTLPSSEVLHFMKNARTAYLFRPKPAAQPQRDDKHIRLLAESARNKLLGLLGRSENWEPGLFTVAEWPPNLGLLFRADSDELVLYCGDMIVEGSFHGRRVIGCLTERAGELLQDWKERYAKQEIKGSRPSLLRPKYRK